MTLPYQHIFTACLFMTVFIVIILYGLVVYVFLLWGYCSACHGVLHGHTLNFLLLSSHHMLRRCSGLTCDLVSSFIASDLKHRSLSPQTFSWVTQPSHFAPSFFGLFSTFTFISYFAPNINWQFNLLRVNS